MSNLQIGIIAIALIIIAVIILIKVLIYKNSKASFLENIKIYEEIDGEYFNKSANTNIKIRHIEDNKFYIEGYYNDKRIIHGSISISRVKVLKEKEILFCLR